MQGDFNKTEAENAIQCAKDIMEVMPKKKAAPEEQKPVSGK